MREVEQFVLYSCKAGPTSRCPGKPISCAFFSTLQFASVLFAVCFKVNIVHEASCLYRQFGCHSFLIQWSILKKNQLWRDG